MPLLHRRELLERQRVDLAEHAPAPARRCAAASPAPRGRTASARASRSPSADLAGERDELVGAVVGDQRLGVEAELLERPLLELLDPHPLLGAGHLVAVHGVDQLVVLAAELAQPATDGEQLLLAAAAACSTACARSVARSIDTSSRLQHLGRPPIADRLGGPALADQPLAALGGAGPGLRARPPRPGAAGRPGRAGRAPRSSEVRSASRASISACRAVRAASRQPLAARRCRAPRRAASSADGEPLAPARRARRRSWSRAASACAIASASRSASPRAARACEPNWPSSSATAARVASDSCSLASATSTPLAAPPPLALEPGQVEPEPLRGRDRFGQLRRSASSTAAWISIRLCWAAEPPAAKWAPSRSPSRVTAVTSGQSATRLRAAREVVDDRGLEEQPAQRGTQRRSGHSTTSAAYVAPPGSVGPVVVGPRGPPPSSRPARPRSSALRWPIAADARRRRRRRRPRRQPSRARWRRRPRSRRAR